MLLPATPAGPTYGCIFLAGSIRPSTFQFGNRKNGFVGIKDLPLSLSLQLGRAKVGNQGVSRFGCSFRGLGLCPGSSAGHPCAPGLWGHHSVSPFTSPTLCLSSPVCLLLVLQRHLPLGLGTPGSPGMISSLKLLTSAQALFPHEVAVSSSGWAYRWGSGRGRQSTPHGYLCGFSFGRRLPEQK